MAGNRQRDGGPGRTDTPRSRMGGTVGPAALSKQDRTQVALALVAVYVLWGSTYFAMRVAVQELAPLLMAGSRFLTAGAAMFLFLQARGAPNPSWREWRSGMAVG